MHNIDEMRISMPEMCVGKGGELVVPTSRKIKARSGWIKTSDAFDFGSSLRLKKEIIHQRIDFTLSSVLAGISTLYGGLYHKGYSTV